jgi:hypothetical protein
VKPARQSTPPPLPPVPESYFLLHPANEAVIQGTSRQLPPLGARTVFYIGLPLIVAAIGLLGYVGWRWWQIIPSVWAGNPPSTPELWIVTSLTLAAALFGIFVFGLTGAGFNLAGKRRTLEREGKVVWGIVTSSSARLALNDRDVLLNIEYRFKAKPRVFVRQYRGQLRERRTDWGARPLPAPGTPIAVMFFDGNNYEVL